jgi:DNA polymerase III subunit epsilon
MVNLPGREEGEKAYCYFEGGMLSRYSYLKSAEFPDPETLEVVPKVPETSYILRQFIHQIDAAQIRVFSTS